MINIQGLTGTPALRVLLEAAASRCLAVGGAAQ